MKRCTLSPLLFVAALAFVPLSGAQTSTSSDGIPGVGELGGTATDLAPGDRAKWLRGRALFDHPFHKSDGLGGDGRGNGVGNGEFNADSCRACHQDPVLGGAGALELNVSRFARDNFGNFQNLPGGQAASKLRPPYVEGREEYPTTLGNEANIFEQRQTPSIFGLGLLDTVSDAEILSHQDPADANMDGISGVARRLTIGGVVEIGRFGWKAQVPRLRDFVKDAMGGEIGVTTPDDLRGFAMLTDNDGVADPELDETQIDEVFFFMANLAAPKRVGSLDPQVLAGELLFEQVGCAMCHLPELAGAAGPVRAYTDLLVHKVMPAAFAGMDDPGARSGEYRTPPLWGIRHTAPYMHDGRAEDLNAAIRLHFSEANAARQAYVALTPVEQEALLAFLRDL